MFLPQKVWGDFPVFCSLRVLVVFGDTSALLSVAEHPLRRALTGLRGTCGTRRSVREVGQCCRQEGGKTTPWGEEELGMGQNFKPPGDRGFWSMFPLTGASFWVHMFDPQPVSVPPIAVLFRLAWLKIEGTGLDGFYSHLPGKPADLSVL